jgi:hypothetical protein
MAGYKTPNNALNPTVRAKREGGESAKVSRMDIALVTQVYASRIGIAADWMHLVREGPKGNPLAEPETMVHLVVPSLDRVLQGLQRQPAESPRAGELADIAWPPPCECQRNPYREFYICGEQALARNLLVKEFLPVSGYEELQAEFRNVALDDIRCFDSVWRKRGWRAAAGDR